MRAEGRTAMTHDEVKDFVSRYMPAYAHYLSGLYSSGSGGSTTGLDLAGRKTPPLFIKINEERRPVASFPQK